MSQLSGGKCLLGLREPTITARTHTRRDFPSTHVGVERARLRRRKCFELKQQCSLKHGGFWLDGVVESAENLRRNRLA